MAPETNDLGLLRDPMSENELRTVRRLSELLAAQCAAADARLRALTDLERAANTLVNRLAARVGPDDCIQETDVDPSVEELWWK